jgi:hypothetical protein
LTCKGTLRQVVIRVNRLEIQSVCLVFSAQAVFLVPFLFLLYIYFLKVILGPFANFEASRGRTGSKI